jgi:hypothetical protein
MGYGPHDPILTSVPHVPSWSVVFAIHLQRCSAMQLAEISSEGGHLADLHEDVIMVRQDAPRGARNTEGIQRGEKLLFEPFESFWSFEDPAMVVTRGGDDSVFVGCLGMWGPVPRKASALPLRNEDGLLLGRKRTLGVHLELPKGELPAKAGTTSLTTG